MLLDFVELDTGTGAVYKRLYAAISQAVEKGIIKKGERLPSIREASEFLSVSRTTVENAYIQLCIEGIAESSPQRGYYILGAGRAERSKTQGHKSEPRVKYDLSGRSIDAFSADTDYWRRTVRQVLRDTDALISYGDPQGEPELRAALAEYSYKARGVRTKPENIVIGAGIGPLLNILCGLTGRNVTVAMESRFEQAESIFSDYGIKTVGLERDRNGARAEGLEKSGADILFLMPSALSKISVTGLSARRNSFLKWASDGKRLVIEDDYNGELRYTARSVTAFQPKCPESTVYIGSFSKLLLPSVRIAYMVLPDRLVPEFTARRGVYNQTCGKTEQSALKIYIESGELEKHLRRLRKLYYAKSRYFCEAAAEIFPEASVTLFESSLTVQLEFKGGFDAAAVFAAAVKDGIALSEPADGAKLRLCFAGIREEEIIPALTGLHRCLEISAV